MNKMSSVILGMALAFSLVLCFNVCGEEKPEEPTYEETLMEQYVVQEFGSGNYYVETWGEDPETGVMSMDVYENGEFFRRYDNVTKENLQLLLE